MLIVAGFTHAGEVLFPSPGDLNKKLKFSRLEQVHDLVKSVSRALVPEPLGFGHLTREYDPKDDYREGEWVRTGDAGIDTALGGGLRVGTITEIAGERLVIAINTVNNAHTQRKREIPLLPLARVIRPNGFVINETRRCDDTHI